MKINLPNQITLARLAMAVVFFACLAQYDGRAAQPQTWLLDLSAGLFVIAALSDVVDGYLARKHNQVTSFGRVIDPFVDKILVIGAYIFLAGDGFISSRGMRLSDVAGWMVVVILGRELLVTSLRGVTEAAGQSFAANAYGKAKMALQSVTIVWVILTVAHPEWVKICTQLRPFMVYLTVIVTFLSAIPYLHAARGVLSQMSVAPKGATGV
ncbi:MAG TPA: CDP-diacylglycerol--glycerol-3-phosphate 3-phosphatidyltransferase [Phycisphaerae bacterium]|nr:CDP-diacylglycerol--glycerol-3-phosphate 3-phosphatidyltransferase [Phycisphaerae bacterium]HOJ75186.1 CDP-diacylglycerol--glycerol-3-phosphate 3-phosphatidyltransferase [Phycisphaerae bacterium]HOM52463.1 CDP-diacylglycerol--glycerol-3-phosphate 3-phosphatidyltransferase [Phycisphaerae bacterium]HON66649.1 CDP-diacylglycerol--glycerol-3-phosphate 3-phosphatidyltransferase [Phycisphaerae bacterium]HOQ85944.1 CDP-diacylglycerol--glycerol-3-phosphate 3-phosphatidyltransferase [Phycisphaerae ba